VIDATVVATVEGTILTKPVSLGQVIQAGATSVSGGTVIATMADMTKVRSRALVNETDIGSVQPGQSSTVTVDAFPDRPFTGVVEKIEPSATVQQNVTMFPVLINLDNRAGLLRSGMNGEVQVLTDERLDALAIPNDAIRSTREARQAAGLLGLNPDSVAAVVSGGRGGRNGNGGQKGVQVQVNRGELDPALQGGGDPQGGARQGGGRRGGGPQLQVSDADCKKVDVARKKKPALAKKIDDLRTKMRDPGADRQSMQGDMRKLYDDLGVDMRTAGACSRRADGGAAGTAGATGVAGQRGGGRGGLGGANFARGQGGGGRGQGGGGQGGRGHSDRGPRNGLIFVQRGTTWQPMVLRLGVANYDVTEVLSDSLKEGDKVAMLSAAALQAARQAQMDRQKASSSPLGGAQPARGGGRGQ
jgi:HlyD family secretion protein